ncbi:MAG TPA: glutamyl-tRNA reductase [Streptosporangiaceae bacterium]
MTVLAVGLSHKSTPVATLERAVLTGDTPIKMLRDVSGSAEASGALVVSTCNRVEVYADVGKFHGAVAVICDLLARHSGVPLDELTPHLYVHYEDRAVQHLLAVTCGLESMVVGESQILGQVRAALKLAREQGTLSRALADVGTLALRTGKRAHAETGIDRAGASLVTVGLAAAAGQLAGTAAGDGSDDAAAARPLAGLHVLIVGAGSMSALAAATVARLGAGQITVANRTRERAEQVAAGVDGMPAGLAGLPDRIAAADLVVSCTGSPGQVISMTMMRAALAGRAPAARPLVLLDLALPRDVEPDVAALPGVSVIDLDALAGRAGGGSVPGHEDDVAAVRRIVAEELAAQLSADRAARVAPTVVALRAKAAQVVDAELDRLAGRLGSMDPRSRQEIARAMRRIADKLLHAPTVRVKELAGSPGADSYEAALRVLFDLDPAAVQAVTQADSGLAPLPPKDGAP